MSKIYRRFIVLLAGVSLFAACMSKYKYWDIDKFRMDQSTLVNLEEIKILYTSQAPEFDNERDYYIHLIVVSKKTGDTVNIMTTANNGLTLQDSTKTFNFIPAAASEERLKKVARDPKFDYLAANSFPTVIGGIGELVSDEEVEKLGKSLPATHQ